MRLFIPSYQLNLSFPHLAVILTTQEMPKNIFCFNNNIMNDNSNQYIPRNYAAGLCGHYHKSSDCFEYPQKSLLKLSAPPPPKKSTCQNLLPKKNPESKFSNPKKSFDHPRHLKSGVPPPPRAYPPFRFSVPEKCRFSLLLIHSLSIQHYSKEMTSMLSTCTYTQTE